jgi:hypothetical protein
MPSPEASAATSLALSPPSGLAPHSYTLVPAPAPEGSTVLPLLGVSGGCSLGPLPATAGASAASSGVGGDAGADADAAAAATASCKVYLQLQAHGKAVGETGEAEEEGYLARELERILMSEHDQVRCCGSRGQLGGAAACDGGSKQGITALGSASGRHKPLMTIRRREGPRHRVHVAALPWLPRKQARPAAPGLSLFAAPLPLPLP